MHVCTYVHTSIGTVLYVHNVFMYVHTYVRTYIHVYQFVLYVCMRWCCILCAEIGSSANTSSWPGVHCVQSWPGEVHLRHGPFTVAYYV